MRDLIGRFYNYYAPLVLILWLTITGHWIWLLGAIGALLVIISNNLEALMKAVAQGGDEIIRRLGTTYSGRDEE